MSKPVRAVPPAKPPVTKPSTGGSGLPATGGSVGLAVLAVGLLGGAVLLRRRRTA